MKFAIWSPICVFICLFSEITSLFVSSKPLTRPPSRDKVTRLTPSTKQHALVGTDQPTNNVPFREVVGIKNVLAKAMGYSLGFGAMSLYSPIIYNLLSTKDSSGFAIPTWILNVLGTMLAISYPIKRGFPFSTYVELSAVLVQGIFVLGLVCLYRGLLPQFMLGIFPSLAIFATFTFNKNIPDYIVKALQVASIAVCTGANIPQIILTFQRQSASWSAITALLSTAGCLVRIFTTVQLTKDRVALVGYALGGVTNGILLAQVIWFNYCTSVN